MFKKPIVSALVCLSIAAAAAQAQNIFVLPGANSGSNTVLVYTSTFNSLTSFTAGSAPFAILAKPDGSKYYVISGSGSQTVTVVDSAFANARSLGNLGTQATAAALTPDGKRLLVVAGSLHVFDTTTDSDLTPNGVLPGTPLTDVAVSLDGTRAFLLGTLPSGQGVLYAVDLTSSNFGTVGNLPLNNIATSLAVGPNGLVYVGAVNRVYEVNPATLLLTPSGEIGTIIRAGKLAFTPDGKYLLVPNLTPGQSQAAVILIDLTSHTVVFQFTIPNLTLSAPNFAGVSGLNISGANLSNEVPGGARASAQNIYVISSGSCPAGTVGSGTGCVYKIDLSTAQIVSASPISSAASVVTVTNPPSAGATPVSFVQYGDKQALAQGATSLPIVVRILDAGGLPIVGTQITFASANPGVVIQNPSVTSGVNGYAATTITAPATSGPAIVTATAGGATASFTFNIGTGGGGGGAPSGGLSIVAGQGQLIFENNNTGIPGFGSPLIVKVTDINGMPVPNASVTFSISTGVGTLLGGSPTPDGFGTIITTDSNGLASAAFLSTTIPPFSGFIQAGIQASAPGTNSVVFYISTANHASPPTVQYLLPQPGTLLAGGAGSVLKGAATVAVVSNLGQPIPNVSLRIIDPQTSNQDPTTAPNSAYAKCVDPTGSGVLTDATGRGVCDIMFTGTMVSGQQISIDVGYHYQGPAYNVTVTAGAPARLNKVLGDAQSGRPGQQLQSAFSVQVFDAAGNGLTGVPVSFQALTPGTITLSNVSVATDQNGRASALGTLGNTAGTFQVKATAGTASITFSFTVTIPAASIQAVSGAGQTALINTAFGSPVVVKVVDTSGAAVAGAQVTFSANGGATVASPTVTTDANGLAQTIVTAGTGAGPITVTASSSGFSTSFSLTSRLPGPTNVTFVNGASFQPGIAPGSIAIIQGNGLLPGVQGLVRPNAILGPMPTSLSGFSVTFGGIPAPIFYVSNQSGQEQVAVQVPFELAPGTATVVINATGGGTATINGVPIQPVAPGLFESQYNGQNFAVVARPDGSYVSPTNPARRGEVDCAFATGLGQTTPAIGTNDAGVPNQNVAAALDFGLNNAGVRVVSATSLQGSVGIYQICFQVPTDTAPGPQQPVGLILHLRPGDPTGDYFAQGSLIPIQ